MTKKLLLSISVISSLCINAQNVDKESVSFNYLRNPLEKTDTSIKNFIVEAEVPWLEKEKQKETDYQLELKNAEEEYNEALAEYNSKTVGSKLAERALLGDSKPVKRSVNKPTIIPQPDLQSIKSAIVLDGYELGSDNAFLIKVIYHDIYVGAPTDKESTQNEVVKKVRSVTIKQPVEFSVIAPNGSVIYNETLKTSNNDFVIKSDEILSKDWNKYVSGEWDAFLRLKLMDYYTKLSQDVNGAINYRFGYSKINRGTTIFMGSGEKFSYETHLLALRKAQRAYEELFTERDEAIIKLKDAIEIWGKELEESNPADKKARISDEVTQALIANIIEAKTFIGDYEGAIDYCDKIDIMADVKKKYEKKVEELRKLIKDEKQRNIKI